MGRTVLALMLREMATTYGRSAGGYLWTILDPVLGVALLSVLFSLALRHPPIGENFSLFYATGYLPFAMFNSLSQKIARSVQFSRPFMAYPCVTFMDMLVARLLLNGLTDIVVMAIIVGGIMVIYNLPFWIDLGSLSLTMGLIILCGRDRNPELLHHDLLPRVRAGLVDRHAAFVPDIGGLLHL